MTITGPHLDRAKKANGQPKHWYLRYAAPRKHPDGSIVLVEGRPVLERKRPYYFTREDAAADKPAILAQYAAAGVAAGGGVLTRDQAGDYERARAIAPEALMVDLAMFWRLHHPLQAVLRVKEIAPLFLSAILSRLGKTAHYEDLDSRVGIFAEKFGERIPDTITRAEILRWLESKPGAAVAGRSILNLKQCVCRFFNWMRSQEPPFVRTNPAGGIRREQLPKIVAKEIAFLDLPQSEHYLRACERYDPELVAHEIVQLLAGVRADDEMKHFRGEWVHPETREVLIPGEFAKTERREVIELEPVFWDWWAVYGRQGRLRPKNWLQRWVRVRVLALLWQEKGIEEADRHARRTMRKLAEGPEFKALRARWPWNARRRTFVTFHVAKEQSAQKTALIIRHRGEAYTLHNSYRGMGVTQLMGVIYFSRQPRKVAQPILPPVPRPKPRGIVRFRLEAAARAEQDRASA